MRQMVGVAAMLCLLLSSSAWATKFVREGASNSNDGTSWEKAVGSIQAGINAASSGEDIWVTQGTYVE